MSFLDGLIYGACLCFWPTVCLGLAVLFLYPSQVWAAFCHLLRHARRPLPRRPHTPPSGPSTTVPAGGRGFPHTDGAPR